MTFSRQRNADGWGMHKQGLAFPDGVETPYSVSVSTMDISPDSKGKRSLPANLFVARYGGTHKFLKRAYLSQALSSDQMKITGAPDSPTSMVWAGQEMPMNLFAPGDMLTVSAPYKVVTISASTFMLSVDGQDATYTGVGTDAAAWASSIAAQINGHAIHSSKVVAKPEAGAARILIYAADGRTPHDLGSAGVLGGLGDSVGTVRLLDYVTGAIVLNEAPAMPVPAGLPVGVPFDELLGVFNMPIDLTNRERQYIAPIAGCHGYYEQSCPYIDGELKKLLPKMRFAMRW